MYDANQQQVVLLCNYYYRMFLNQPSLLAGYFDYLYYHNQVDRSIHDPNISPYRHLTQHMYEYYQQ